MIDIPELPVEMGYIVETAIETDPGNTHLTLYQQLTRMVQPYFIDKGGKGFTRVPAKVP